MAQVTVTINGYNYTVGCSDEQEEHLHTIVQEVEKHIECVRQLGGQSGEGKMLALAGLLMADKIHDLELELENLKHNSSEEGVNLVRNENDKLKKQLQYFADRAEAIAGKLEVS
ncbi:hypothetical protein COMNV_01029 [Commensalibacter sp. Nvir]|uniref:cell division protein ZapA n=1 Tax=Commensalibacter sp. Nvir TaxID=3069817 RepID=UPI002D7056F0|nr:hypothetical protein COMNV_01029 [Commensalibacter sp. Nvir]